MLELGSVIISKQQQMLLDFISFVNEYDKVMEAVRTGQAKPWSRDPVLAAYDLRPRAMDREPRRARLSAALKELGYFNPPPPIDQGLFNLSAIERIQNIVTPRLSILKIMQLVVSYYDYKRLSDGRVSRWRILRG